MTEPTTFYRILSPSAASERLLDIVYEVTLQRLLKQKLSGEEACRSEALRKKEKWANIPAFLVVTVGGMNDQTPSLPEDDTDYFSELPYVPPSDTRQLEDYASTCASIQNLLLSLHSEGLVSKWATGPVIRTPAFRELIGCKPSDMVVGLIFVGWSKREPRMPRRRRNLDGDVMRDV
jgi:nitroreductase